MTCSMAMCGFVNMSIVKTGAGLVSQREEAHFLQRCRAFAHGCECFGFLMGARISKRNTFGTRTHTCMPDPLRAPSYSASNLALSMRGKKRRWIRSVRQVQAGQPTAGAAAHIQDALGAALRARVAPRLLHVCHRCALLSLSSKAEYVALLAPTVRHARQAYLIC